MAPMNRRSFVWSALALPMCAVAQPNPDGQARPPASWQALFAAADVPGTLVVVDARAATAVTRVHDAQRAERRVSPASTFKIPHTLFVLDAGLVRDEFQVFRWDGTRHAVPAWNRDQTVRSAMRDSTVWLYEAFARELGTERETAYLRKIHYGNELATGPTPFWVDGDLAVSAQEQIALLRALYANTLPFAVAHQRLVKDLIVYAAGSRWILRAKSGWSGRIGWWVGWIEFGDGPVFFALNIDTPRRQADLPHRISIVREALRSLDAWPSDCSI